MPKSFTRTAGMANLQTLPQELWEAIEDEIRDFSPQTARSTFASMCLVSTTMRPRGEASLYRDICWPGVTSGDAKNLDSIYGRTGSLPKDGKRLHDPSQAPPVYLLVRSLLSNTRGERLGKHIKGVHVRNWHRTRISMANVRSAYTDIEWKALREAQSGEMYWWQHGPWQQSLEYGKTDFFLSYVLTRARHNLKSLSLDFHYGASKSLVGCTIAGSKHEHYHPPLKTSFPALREVKYVNERAGPFGVQSYNELAMHVNHLVPLFCNCSIKSIAADSISWEPLDMKSFGRPFQQNAAGLKCLTLTNVRCHEQSLELLLRSCSSLQSLTWKRLCDCNYDESCVVDLNVLWEALEHVKETLENLTLDYEFYTSTAIDIGNPGPWQLVGRLNLIRMNRLKTVDVPAAVLLGWKIDEMREFVDILPVALEHLTLSDETVEMTDNEFAEQPSTALDNLMRYIRGLRSLPDVQSVIQISGNPEKAQGGRLELLQLMFPVTRDDQWDADEDWYKAAKGMAFDVACLKAGVQFCLDRRKTEATASGNDGD